MIYYIPEGHGCAYSICSEGELFYTPISGGDTIYLEETDVIDLDDLPSCCIESEIPEIHSKLISMNQTAGFYFK